MLWFGGYFSFVIHALTWSNAVQRKSYLKG